MIGPKALTLLGLAALAAVPTVGMARQHYTGGVPTGMSAVEPVTVVAPVKKARLLATVKSAAAKKVTIKSKHKKHKKHKKTAAKK